MDHDAQDRRTPGFDAADLAAVRCADCARSDSAAEHLRPVDHMPIPAEALLGFPDGVPRTSRYNRRTFLRHGAVGMASVYAASQIDWTRAFEAGVAEGATGPTQVVMLFLNGGLDGLDALVPIGAAEHALLQQRRPQLHRALGPSTPTRIGTTEVPGTGGVFGWANTLIGGAANNGGAKGMDTLWGDGLGGVGSDLAVFPSTDYNPPNLSHFDSREYWFSGDLRKLATGWLGRWLDAYGSMDNPLQAVSIGSTVSKQIVTARAPVAAIANLNAGQFALERSAATQIRPVDEIGALAAAPVGAGNAGLGRSRSAYAQSVDVARKVSSLSGGAAPPGYPNSSLSDRLRTAATLLGAGVGVRVVTIDWGSFDTHGNQRASIDPQLRVLSQALTAFKDDLTTRGIEQNVLTVVFTEFGRRIAENQSGTDHGAGAVMAVMGSAVRGGLRAEFPGVANPDRRGNLQVTTDFRSVYQALIAEWLGGDPTRILPGGPFAGFSASLLA